MKRWLNFIGEATFALSVPLIAVAVAVAMALAEGVIR